MTRREELEAICFMLGDELRKEMNDARTGPRIGFVLMLYDYGPGGFCAYTGSGNREDSIKLIREHLRMLETQTQ